MLGLFQWMASKQCAAREAEAYRWAAGRRVRLSQPNHRVDLIIPDMQLIYGHLLEELKMSAKTPSELDNETLLKYAREINDELNRRAIDPAPPQDVAAFDRYSHSRWDELLSDTWKMIEELSVKKGGEYAGDDDRLANFRRNARDCGCPMELVWRIYAGKHWDAISQFIKDLQTGKERERMEPISGRVDDLIVYLLLFKAILEERAEGKVIWQKEGEK